MEQTSFIEIGEQLIIDREIREVTNVSRNIEGDVVVVWKSKHSCGACIPSLWYDWRNGIGINY